jgi:hypothetical protein
VLVKVEELIARDGRRCNRRRGSMPVDAYARELLREGAAVDVDRVRRTLAALTRSDRRQHRDAAGRVLRRLESSVGRV